MFDVLLTYIHRAFEYKLCSSSLRLVSLFVWGRLHIGTFQELIKRKLARSFDFTFCYTYDVLWLNNSKFGNCNDCIFPIEHEIKDTTDTAKSTFCRSYLGPLGYYPPKTFRLFGFPIIWLSKHKQMLYCQSRLIVFVYVNNVYQIIIIISLLW